jgi:hypothetical protein
MDAHLIENTTIVRATNIIADPWQKRTSHMFVKENSPTSFAILLLLFVRIV